MMDEIMEHLADAIVSAVNDDGEISPSRAAAAAYATMAAEITRLKEENAGIMIALDETLLFLDMFGGLNGDEGLTPTQLHSVIGLATRRAARVRALTGEAG